ncbi:hypothetical protein SAMN04489868_101163 [Pisciglobus halotolerans]|uniref:Uncharacterized protein n=1 Tax=Pisciglobus halotolerans TaxID=745365 RepID=A0A1I3ARE5_9LACT|nr:hypothetical protein SAMN04489868_101163 [Pisciglobus halotolerans]
MVVLIKLNDDNKK